MAGQFSPWKSTIQQNTNANENKIGQTTSSLFDPSQFEAPMQWLMSHPNYVEQEKGIKGLENQLSLVQNTKNSESGWVKPLLALADSQTGSKLMEGYTEPDKNKMALLLKYQDEIAKRKGDQYKNVLDGLSKFKSGGSETLQLIDKIGSLAANKTGTGKASNGRQIPANTAIQLGEAYKTPGRIQELIDTINADPSVMGLKSAGETGLKSIFGQESPGDVVNNMIQSLRQDIGKMKEGGVLRLEDERKYNKMLPSQKADPAKAIKVLQQMQHELSQKVLSHQQGLKAANFDTAEFEKMNSGLINPPAGGGIANKKQMTREEKIKLLQQGE